MLYLGLLPDSVNEVFCLVPAKKEKFMRLTDQVLGKNFVNVKTLQRLVGKCVSFSLAVPTARLFTKEMNLAISWGVRTQKLIPIRGPLREEIVHWSSLETLDSPLPWRDERHIRVTMATDASDYGWGFAGLTGVAPQQASDYWSPEEQELDISTKEALAMEKMLLACREQLKNARVDVLVDNQAVVQSWNNQSGKSATLNKALKRLFFTTSRLNVLLHLEYIPSKENPADFPLFDFLRLTAN